MILAVLRSLNSVPKFHVIFLITVCRFVRIRLLINRAIEQVVRMLNEWTRLGELKVNREVASQTKFKPPVQPSRRNDRSLQLKLKNSSRGVRNNFKHPVKAVWAGLRHGRVPGVANTASFETIVSRSQLDSQWLWNPTSK